MDDLENFRLKVFRTVARELSFRKAAEVLHLSQPAVSQQVRALEEATGARLFDRGTGSGHGTQIALTEAGRVLLGYATRAAKVLAEAEQTLAGLSAGVAGELHIGASTTVAQYVLPHILGAFLRQYPQVRMTMTSGNTEAIAEAAASETVMLGIIEGPAMRRDVAVQRMVRDQMVLVAGMQHPWSARKTGLALKELAEARLLLREQGSGSRRVVERALRGAGVALRTLDVVMELDSTEAIVSGVEAGLGVGFVSRWALRKPLQLGTVKVVRVEGLKIERDFSFVRAAGTELSGAAAAFQRFALAAVAGSP
ncbi:MAG: LysR family transcriptional regulator [Acidobacteriota bacterium]|nr:LysR family transcriptional regulator [Acidobacteriota bacterium]